MQTNVKNICHHIKKEHGKIDVALMIKVAKHTAFRLQILQLPAVREPSFLLQ